jgi:REP element-mobilizing transposase RayT
MKHPVRHPAVRQALVPLILTLALVGAACGKSGHQASRGQVNNPTAAPTAAAPAPTKADPVATSETMRKLWEEHVTWTRLYIVSAVSGLPDAQPTLDRLLRNQDDIGTAIKPFYGDDAGAKLTQLLRTHIAQAGDLVKAAKANDQAALAKAKDAWFANANDIATFLSRANPKNWPMDQVKAMMDTHLNQTISEATHRLQRNYPAEIADYDAIENHILSLADTLSGGVVAQFPDKFSPPSVPPSQAEFRKAMRKLWEEHVTWTRLYIVSALSGLPDAQPTLDRLMRNQDDIGAAIKPYYGAPAATKLTQLLRTHITQAGDLVKAAKAGDQAALAKAKDAWYANADDIATFLSQANPKNWPLDQVKAMMHTHLEQTIAEATDRLQKNQTAEIADYDAIEDHILKLADALSTGIVAQFPGKFTA